MIEESPGHDVPQRPYPKLIFIGPNGLRSGWRFVIFNTLFVGISSACFRHDVLSLPVASKEILLRPI